MNRSFKAEPFLSANVLPPTPGMKITGTAISSATITSAFLDKIVVCTAIKGRFTNVLCIIFSPLQAEINKGGWHIN